MTTLVNPYRVLGATAASRTTPAASGTFGRLLHRIGHWFVEQRRYQETLSELGSLTDRELDDIGLTRGDIEFVARRCARSV
jgi:uncharacterized protein YjiS (DUF1127 family)